MEIVYIVFSYYFMLGVILEEFKNPFKASYIIWLFFLFSPFVLPMLLGMKFCKRF